MSTKLEDWAPRIALRLRSLPAKQERRLRALVGEAEADARRNASKDTGDLARSVYAKLTARKIEIGATAPYARRVEEGGTILPKKARMLAIPLQRGLPKSGPRADGKLFLFRSKDGRLFLAKRNGKQLDVRWKLQASVTQKARPFLRPAVERLRKRLPPELLAEFTRTLKGVR